MKLTFEFIYVNIYKKLPINQFNETQGDTNSNRQY